MAALYLPTIRRQDYETFRRMLGTELPPTYQKWLKLCDRTSKEHALYGHPVWQVDVAPEEFARYCASKRAVRDRASLVRFMMEKSEGKRY